MKRLLHSAVAVLAAVCALLLLAGAVRSGGVTDRVGRESPQPAAQPEPVRQTIDDRIGSESIQAASEFSRTRIVTITVGTTTTAPFTPSLNSRWQIDIAQQEFYTGPVQLPADAYAISTTLVNGDYRIDYSNMTIFITHSQGMYYEYYTDQQAQRLGNQILISQVHSYNHPLRYIGTVIFTEPYQYVGYAGYSPTQISATQVHWDQSFPVQDQEPARREFDAAMWLIQPGAFPRPDLQIITATLANQLNHLQVIGEIQNNGPISTAAPAYLNFYERLAPSVPPTEPLDLTGSWCSLTPVSKCAIDPLPVIPPFETINFTIERDLVIPIYGQHDIYLFIDALGGSQGLNVESAEDNNVYQLTTNWIGYGIFLPIVQHQ